MLPPYVGPALGLELNVAAKVEVVDHVVPGALIVVCGGLAALLARRVAGEQLLALAGLCFLAGVWQAATHAPLVLDGGSPAAPWGSVLLHSTAGPVIAALALSLTMKVYSAEPADARRSA